MKILTYFVRCKFLLGLCLIVLGILCPVSLSARSYKRLWQDVERYAAMNQPKTACLVLQDIRVKALKSNNRYQEMAAFLAASAFREQISSDSFFVDFRELEKRVAMAKEPADRALYALFAAEACLNNVYRGGWIDGGDALPVEYWSKKDYYKRAAAYYRIALCDLPALRRADANDYEPLVFSEKDDRIFGDDLLHLVARKAISGMSRMGEESLTERHTYMHQVLQVYRAEHMRRAELLLLLDSLQMSPVMPLYRYPVETSDSLLYKSELYQGLDRLRYKFADLQEAAEVYLAMASLGFSDSVRMALLQEGVQRYPKYRRIGLLHNQIREMERASFQCNMPETGTPGDTVSCILSYRNVSRVDYSFYAVSHADAEWLFMQAKSVIYDWLKKQRPYRQGRMSDIRKPEHSYLMLRDTLQWVAPEPGIYLIKFRVTSPSGDKSDCLFFQATALKHFILKETEGNRMEAFVTHASSGKSVSDACVELVITQNKNGEERCEVYHTDALGRVTIDLQQGYHYKLRACVPGDTTAYISGTHFVSRPKERISMTSVVLTDRGIYRPGQTVHATGVAYCRTEKGYQVAADSVLQVSFFDASGREVQRDTVCTDVWGGWQADYLIPEKMLKGRYHVRCGSVSQYFTVEEYLRPAFEVLLDPNLTKALVWGDTLRMSGMVRSFTGAPSAYTRVIVHADMRASFPTHSWQNKGIKDTLFTDAAGRFSYCYPLPLQPRGEMPWIHYSLACRVEALHASGQVATQSRYYTVNKQEHSITIDCADILCTDRPDRKIRFNVQNSRYEQLYATVFFSLKPVGNLEKTVLNGKLPSNSSFDLQGIDDLPSGRYRLEAMTLMGRDTLKTHKTIILYAASDSHVPVDTAFWCQILTPKSEDSLRFECQIGTSFHDVSLHAVLTRFGCIVEHKLHSLSDTMFVYRLDNEYEHTDGLTLHLAFVRNQKLYSRVLSVPAPKRSESLSYRWITFRDNLEPGAREQWTLQVLQGNGQPVVANSMFTMYDASLDELSHHLWRFEEPRSFTWSVPYLRDIYMRQLSAYLDFPVGATVAGDYQWGYLNIGLLTGSESFVRKPLVHSGMKNRNVRILTVAKGSGNYAMGRMPQNMAADMVAESAPEEQNIMKEEHEYIRKQLEESALFFSGLRSDSLGCIRLDFTMPQALTRWHLMGIAYTQDMQHVSLDTIVTTRKKLMASLYLPAYLYEHDETCFHVSVDNLADEADAGVLQLEVADAATDTVLWVARKNFHLEPNTSAKYEFEFKAPAGYEKVVCRVLAKGRKHTDGEQRQLKIVTPVKSVIYSRPFVLRASGTYSVPFQYPEPLRQAHVMPEQCLVTYHHDPTSAVFQVLPVLAQSASAAPLELAAAYYARISSASLWRHYPAYRAWLEDISVKQSSAAGEICQTRMSSLMPRMWEQTPWERVQNFAAGIGNDSLHLEDSLSLPSYSMPVLEKLVSIQNMNGSFSFMPGMNESEPVTLDVLSLLQQSGRPGFPEADALYERIQTRGLDYLKRNFVRRRNSYHTCPGLYELRFMELIARSLGHRKAVEVPEIRQALTSLEKNQSLVPYSDKIYAATVSHIYGRDKMAHTFMHSVREHLVQDTLGNCYFDNASVYGQHDGRHLLYHLQALELFRSLCPEDSFLIQGMEQWALLQKRIQGWGNSYLSARAASLLLKQDDAKQPGWCDSLFWNSDGILRPVGDAVYPMADCIWNCRLQNSCPDALQIVRSKDGVTWGALFTQYILSPDSIFLPEKKWGDLSVAMSLESDELHVGDKLKNIYMIRANQDYDQMLLKISSSAACRPEDKFSGYRSVQGVSYYQSVEDDGLLLFFDHLPKGYYMLEIPFEIQFAGTYLHGGAEFQSYYAPEFRTYAAGKRIKISGR